jgi:hypothetical protein
MGNLIGISANVPQEFIDKKQRFGVSWVFIIREGIKNIELQEKLMNEKINPDNIDWRIRAREKIEEALHLVR